MAVFSGALKINNEIKIISHEIKSKMLTIGIKIRRGMVMKPGKHQRSKQRSQDFCWRFQDRGQSFVLRSYTIKFLSTKITAIVFCAPSGPKSEQKPN